jgi:predicted DNA-binding transcriptional regulator AlpA
MNLENLPRLLNKKGASQVLGVSITTLDLLRKTKGLRSVKIGWLVRFDPKDLQEFIARHKSRRPLLKVNCFPND